MNGLLYLVQRGGAWASGGPAQSLDRCTKCNSPPRNGQCVPTLYEGRSLNKLQNGVIRLLFKIWKIRNSRFVGDLILSASCEFYYDDVTVTFICNH